MSEFFAFPKIARWSREVVVTEKIDGTNAQVAIAYHPYGVSEVKTDPCTVMHYGRRNGWIGASYFWEDGTIHHPDLKSKDDNYGFGRWCQANWQELMKLGVGTHYGEWWGQGIQRGYGLTEKRFSLFNTGRWNAETKPACCHVVPVISQCVMTDTLIEHCMAILEIDGSHAAPGFMKPEGICIYHTQAGIYFKKTFEKDATGKEAA